MDQTLTFDLNVFTEWIIGAFGLLLTMIGILIRKAQSDQAVKAEEHRKLLEKILTQVTQTNGRVIALETWRDGHEKEVNRIMGGINEEFKQVWAEFKQRRSS